MGRTVAIGIQNYNELLKIIVFMWIKQHLLKNGGKAEIL